MEARFPVPTRFDEFLPRFAESIEGSISPFFSSFHFKLLTTKLLETSG